MDEASRAVLGGFTLRTEAKVVRAPDRYRDRRGAKFWRLLMGVLDRVERASAPPVPPLITLLVSYVLYLYLL